MKRFHVVLTIVMLALMLMGALELGLRFMGAGPQPTIHRFDADLGWSKIPYASSHRVSREFDVRFQIDGMGLRDDFAGQEKPQDAEWTKARQAFLAANPTADVSPAKRDNRKRVLVLGDSFVLGYTVDRSGLFVDLLEQRFRAEQRAMDVVNAGTEGWSTDQEVVWYERHGQTFDADTVVLCTYDNDLWWNGQTKYRRFPKPRFRPYQDGQAVAAEGLVLQDPGARAWWESTAVGTLVSNLRDPMPTWVPEGSERRLDLESTAYFVTPPPELVQSQAVPRTAAALKRLEQLCKNNGAMLIVAPIPNKAAIVEDAQARFLAKFEGLEAQIRADQPVETVLALCKQLRLTAVDARPALRSAAAKGAGLYYDSDWHLDPSGNLVFAEFLYEELDKRGLLAPPLQAASFPALPAKPFRWGPWALWLALTAALGTIYSRLYRDESALRAYTQVGLLVGIVIGMAIGGSRLVAAIPPPWSMLLVLALIAALVTFVLVKLGPRLSTAMELLGAFTRRGHWYLMPLVVILVTIGSLLVVAASSPLVAPFIYTLF